MALTGGTYRRLFFELFDFKFLPFVNLHENLQFYCGQLVNSMEPVALRFVLFVQAY